MLKSINILKNLSEIKIIKFDHRDVVRHPLVSKIITAYQKIIMIKVNVILDNINWRKYINNPKVFIKNRINLLNKKIIFLKKLIFSLALSDTTKIKKLNRLYRKKNLSTDVLSFPFYEKNIN